jgi:Fe-S cluster assembly protein SufD
MADVQNTTGSTTAGSIEVGTAGAGAQLAGPGTGRTEAGVSQPVDARAEAVASYDVADFPVPTGREENWRFTPLHRLRGLHDGTAEADGGVRVEISAPAGVSQETVDRTDARVGSAGKPVDRIAAQAFTSFEKALVVSVPKETVLTEPIRISVHGEGGTAYGHQVVELGAFAEAVVVIEHTGDAVVAANVEYLIGDGAKLTVVSVQDWEPTAVHVAQHTALVGRDASFK